MLFSLNQMKNMQSLISIIWEGSTFQIYSQNIWGQLFNFTSVEGCLHNDSSGQKNISERKRTG